MEKEKVETYGVTQPVSAATVPSVYNKKLNKLFRGRLVVLSGDTNVATALRQMAKFNITAVPVTKSKKDTSLLGFASMLDFVCYFCKLLGNVRAQDLKEAGDLREKTEQFQKTPIREIVDCSGRNPFYVIDGEESLANAVQQYLKGVHRIAISDENGDIIGIISQWTIVNYLATVPTDDKEWIPSLRATLGNEKWNKYTKEVVTCHNSTPTLDCFLKMAEKNLTAIGIVDDSGVLVGNLSVSDIKGFELFFADFKDLLQPVSDFLSTIRKKQGRPANFVVAATLNTSVKDLVERMNQEIIHRIYVVDNDYKPIGIFTLTDLLKGLIVDTHTLATFAKSTAVPEETP